MISVTPNGSSAVRNERLSNHSPSVQQHPRGYGATAARLTPDQKVGSSNLSALISMRRMGGLG